MLRSDRFTYDNRHVRNGDFIVFLDRFTSFEGNPEIKSIEKKIRQNEVVKKITKNPMDSLDVQCSFGNYAKPTLQLRTKLGLFCPQNPLLWHWCK